jgi:predicted Rossmann fold flavoprotein
VVVVGAGAAGLLAAIAAASMGAGVLLLERTKDGGRKILISGGGRCNVLPARLQPERYVTTSSPHLMRKLLLAWPLAEQRRFFEQELGLALVLEEETGKLFPATQRARDVRDGLVELARRRGARLRFGARVTDLRPPAGEHDPWHVLVAGDETPVHAAAVILATGGLSVPQTGSDGAGLAAAQRLGHTVHPTFPALTPLTASPPPHAHLAGVSLEVTIAAPLAKGHFTTRGGFLFTHRGYSGPAVLDASHLAVRSLRAGGERQPLLVRWTELDADAWDAELRAAGSVQVATLLRRRLPLRLADTLRAEAGVAADRTGAQLRREERARLVAALTRYPLPWTGDEGYRKAEVTGGGVALNEVDPRTLESRRRPRLFLCGELLDAFGPIGGHNFAWAWASGRAAGRGAAQRVGVSQANR